MVRLPLVRALMLGVCACACAAVVACSASSSDSAASGTGGGAQPGTGGGAPLGTGGASPGGGPPASGGTTGPGTPAATGGSAVQQSGGAVGTGSGGTSSGGAASGGQAAGGTTAPPLGGRGTASGGASPAGGSTGSSTDPGTAGDGMFMIGPTYTRSPDLTLKPGAPAGFQTQFSYSSTQSKIFNGSDFTPPLTFTRTVTIFVPAQYVDGTESPFMVSSDGFFGGLKTTVQNLADDPNPDHHVPPLAIIGLTAGPDVRPSSERSLEYDTVSDRYWRYITTEIMPAILANAELKKAYPNFKFTTDPNGRGGYGCSSGGPAVMGLAWFGDFNRVFSFSGSYVAIQKTADHPLGAYEYTKMVMDAPLRPDLRVFLEVGQNDNGSGNATASGNWVTSNRSLAAALIAKGNHTRFMFAQGAGHCDNNPRNQITPEGLIWLWRGYKAPGK